MQPCNKKYKRTHHALEANSRAKAILASECNPSDAQVLEVLELLDFAKTKTRKNIMREERKAEGVRTETLGLTRNKISLTLESVNNIALLDSVCALLCKWVDGWALANGIDIAVTSIQVNKDFAAERHRDKNNLGPSVVRALGAGTGGELLYWPMDATGHLGKLDPKNAITFDVRQSELIINTVT
jgi:hypothetical protein